MRSPFFARHRARSAIRLRFLNGPRTGSDAVFRRSPVRAGRSRDNDLRLPDTGEPLASGRHAEFVLERGHWWIVDLDSTNGTRVNGARVARARVADGDRITLGDQDVEVRIGHARLGGPVMALVVALALVAALVWLFRPPARTPLDAIASAARQSVFLVVIQDGERRTPVGTAFAIEGGHVVTNAHVAAPLAALDPGGPRLPFLVSVDAREPPRRIRGLTLHPNWQAGSIADDVARLAVDGSAPAPLGLADDAGLRALAPGDTIAIFGFPAAFTEPDRPHGSLTVGELREVRGARYFDVGMAVTPGASGSPVFAADGRVIGMIAGSGREHAGVAISASVIREMVK